MADSYVRVPADSSGKKVDATSLDVGADTVYRQRIVIADNSATAQYATVTGGALLVAGTVNISGTAQVAGAVTVSNTVTVDGSVNLSATASVVIGAGTSNIGLLNSISRTVQVAVATPFTINNISATVNVALGAGSAVIGDINAISRTVQVAIATPFTINNISATAAITGTVALAAGAANIGTINNISATVTVAGNVNISATHSVILAAGTANIGTLNDISRTVQVAIATPHTVNNISATVMVAITSGGGSGFSFTDGTPHTAQEAAFVPVGGVFDDASPGTLSEGDAGVARITTNRALHVNLRDAAGAGLGTAGAALAVNVHAISATASVVIAAGTNNIGTLNNISRTVTVVGVVSLAAGTNNFGTLNDISRTVQVAIATPHTVNNISATVMVAVAGYTPPTVSIMSSSHGPKCVTASTSANVTLIASPGAGNHVYITQLMVGNNAASKTLARVGTSASISTVVQPCAADGGGYVLNFDPPWKLSASEAAVCSVKPNASQVYFTVNFYVGT